MLCRRSRPSRRAASDLDSRPQRSRLNDMNGSTLVTSRFSSRVQVSRSLSLSMASALQTID